jgi:hypothetical protein
MSNQASRDSDASHCSSDGGLMGDASPKPKRRTNAKRYACDACKGTKELLVSHTWKGVAFATTWAKCKCVNKVR